MDIQLQMNAIVNGKNFRVEGTISGEQGGGGGVANVKILDPTPAGYDIALLPYCLMTGQPSLSASTDGAINPFITTGGEYVATRTLNLGAHGHLTTNYKVQKTSNGLITIFNLFGHTNVPKLKRVLPAVETWSPVGKGNIHGHFSMVWEAENGSFIKGEADTNYLLDLEETIPSAQYRYIQIDITKGEDWLRQDERIVLYTPDMLLQSLRADYLFEEPATA